MKDKISTRRGGDNALENYFLELVIQKHIIDREIQELINITEKSPLHPEYQMLVKKLLFGENNIYIEHWGTLAGSLMDIVKNDDLRSHHMTKHGIILEMMMNVIETVFNVEDDMFYEFLMSESKEDIEHQLVILMKRILDFAEQGLKELLASATHLDRPMQGHIRKEFSVIQQTLLKYPDVILGEEEEHIEYLKNQVEEARSKLISNKKNLHQMSGIRS